MPKVSTIRANSARRAVDALLRNVMIWLFLAGAMAITVLWTFESSSGLLDEVAKVAYPIMLVTFTASAALLYLRPDTVMLARWIGFSTITAFLFAELFAALWQGGPLVGNYAFISLLMWLPLAYAIALLMLEPRHASRAAAALFAFMVVISGAYVLQGKGVGPDDKAMLANLLMSHVVLLACLSGLVRIKLALFRADVLSRRLLAQASTDPLTGLANRRYGLEMLRHAASVHAAGTPSAVILCDIDRFKEINDQHGHDIGDQVVLHIAKILAENTRELDTVIRWGGDEFLISVPQIGSDALREMAERLRACITETSMPDPDGPPVLPSMSIGIAEMAENESLENWIKRADEALYLAKLAGRNRCVFARTPAQRISTQEQSDEPVLDSAGLP